MRPLKIWLTFLMAISALTQLGSAADVRSVWVGPLYGSWTEPTNWLHIPALPEADYPHNDTLTYDVEITNGYAVIPPAPPFSIDALTLGGGTLHSDYNPVTIRGPVLWANGGFFGQGTFILSNGLVITGEGDKQVYASTLKLSGATIINTPGPVGAGFWENSGSLELQSDGTFTGQIINQGPVRKTGGTGTNFFEDVFESRDFLEILSGTIQCMGFAKIGGRIHVETNTALVCGSGLFGLGGSNVIVTGGGLIRFTSSVSFMDIQQDVVSTADLEVSNSYLGLNGIWTICSNAVATIRNSEVAGSGAFVVNPGSILEVSGGFGLGGLTGVGVTNSGMIRLVGTGQINGHGKLVNNSVVELADDVTLTGNNDNFFDNYGVLRKSDGPNTSILNSRRFNNQGLVEVNSGTLWLPGGGTNSGAFRTAAGATLEFVFHGGMSSGIPLFSEGTTFTGEGTNRIFWLSCRVSGNVTNLGRFEMRGGSMADAGTTPAGVFCNESNATLVLFQVYDNELGCLVRNRGTLLMSEGVRIQGLGVIENRGSASLASGIVYDGPFNNFGHFRKHTANTAWFRPQDHTGGLNNFGVCEVEEGSLILESGGTSSGTFLVESNASIHFQYQNKTLTEGARIAGSGSAWVEGPISIEGNVTNTANLYVTSGIVQGPGNLVVTDGGTLMWDLGAIAGSGGLEITPSGQLRASRGGWNQRTINNHGLALFNGGQVIGHDGVFNNFGLLVVSNGCEFKWDGVGAKPLLNNSGTLVVTGSVFGVPANFTNTGTLLVQNGSFGADQLVNAGDATVLGNLGGSVVENRSGILRIAGSIGTLFTNNAVLEIGPGTGRLNLASALWLSPSSVVNIDIGGTNAGVSYDQITLVDDPRLDGVLNVRLANNFQPVLGQRFAIFTHYSYVSGFFARIHGLNLGNGLRLVPVDSYRAFELVVAAAPPPGNVPMTIQQVYPNRYLVSWPSGFNGFYVQSTTNLVTAPWETMWINQGASFDWNTAAIFFPDTEPRYNQPQRFFRLFDPDSP